MMFLDDGSSVEQATTAASGLLSKIGQIKDAVTSLVAPDRSTGLDVIPKTIRAGFEAASIFQEKLISTNRTLGASINYTKIIQKDIAQAGINALYMGGNLNDVITTLEVMNKKLERTTYFSMDFLSNVQAVKKFGVGEDTISTFVSFFDKVGGGMNGAINETIRLVNTAQDYGLNAGKFVQDVASQMDKLNRYGFPKGVEDLASMVAKSKILGDTLSVAQGFADQIMDSPEKAYEYAAQLQTLGGSFSQLGDGAQLLYMAQNDLKGLQDQIINATRGIATFNETTGQFQISANERLRLRQLKNLNLDVEKIEETALKLAKQEKIIQELNFTPTGFKDLPKEQKELIANFAQITKGGVVEVKGEKVSSATDFPALVKLLQGDEENRLGSSVEKNVKAIENNLSANESVQLSLNKLNNVYAIGILKQEDLSKSFTNLTAIATRVNEKFESLATTLSKEGSQKLEIAKQVVGVASDSAITEVLNRFNTLIDANIQKVSAVKGDLKVDVKGVDLKLAEVIKTTIVTEVSNQLNARGYSSGTATR